MSSGAHQWIEHYGVLGVFLSAAAEGEIGVVIGGAMARLGELDAWLVGIAAWVGAFVSTQAFFHIGRSQRDGRLVRRIADKRAFAVAITWIERHPHLFCFFYRFIYGFRIAGPVAISLSQVEARMFAAINIVSALVWATAATLAGYWFGPKIAHWVAGWMTPQHLVLATLVACAALLAWANWRART